MASATRSRSSRGRGAAGYPVTARGRRADAKATPLVVAQTMKASDEYPKLHEDTFATYEGEVLHAKDLEHLGTAVTAKTPLAVGLALCWRDGVRSPRLLDAMLRWSLL